MMTLTVGILDALVRSDSQGSPRCFQVLAAPPLAGFEVISLRPFIPGVDEDKRVSREILAASRVHARLQSINDFAQPAFVKFWGGVDKKYCVLRPSGAIVPSRADTRYSRVRRNRSRQRSPHKRLVIIDAVLAQPPFVRA